MKKILILGAAPVQVDAMKELKKMGVTVYAIARLVGKGVPADYSENIDFMDTDKVIEYIKDNNIDIVYSVGSDMAIPQACKISTMLGMPKFVSEEAAKNCNDKTRMRTSLGNDFKGNVKFQIVESSSDDVELDIPFILKPADSQGQRGVAIINDMSQYEEAFNIAKAYSRSGKVILEDYIEGQEISVNTYMVDGELKFIQASDRITWDEYFGLIHKHELPSKSLDDKGNKELRDILEKACQKLGIENGPMYAQVKVENNKPYIIEITPRLDGCHMWNILEKYTGVNLIRLTFEHLLNGDVSELENYRDPSKNYTLEFVCQKPNTPAKYGDFKEELEKYPSFTYYEEGENVNPVNNRYEKIAYFIYSDQEK
ncbi:ATP-grasp domain-containing protein [Peptoniphilaceae bacterium SGI.131]